MKKNNIYRIVLVSLGLLSIFGYRYYQERQRHDELMSSLIVECSKMVVGDIIIEETKYGIVITGVKPITTAQKEELFGKFMRQ